MLLVHAKSYKVLLFASDLPAAHAISHQLRQLNDDVDVQIVMNLQAIRTCGQQHGFDLLIAPPRLPDGPIGDVLTDQADFQAIIYTLASNDDPQLATHPAVYRYLAAADSAPAAVIAAAAEHFSQSRLGREENIQAAAVLVRLQTLLADDRPLHERFSDALALIGSTLRVQSVELSLLPAAPRTATAVLGQNLGWHVSRGPTVPLLGQWVLDDVVSAPLTELLPIAYPGATPSPLDGRFQAAGLQELLAIPLRIRRRNAAMLCLLDQRWPHRWTPEQRDLIEAWRLAIQQSWAHACDQLLLQESREQLAMVRSSGQLVFWEWDFGHDTIKLGKHWQELTGNHSQRINLPISEWQRQIHPGDFLRVQAETERCLGPLADPPHTTECRVLTADGRWAWISWQVHHAREVSHQHVVVYGTCCDINARRDAEEAGGRLIAAVDQAAEAVIITTPDATIEYVNPAFTQISGYTAEESLGRNCSMLKSGNHPAAIYHAMWQQITMGEVWQGRLTNRRKDGTLYLVDATISPVRDASGHIVSYVAVQHDVTAQLELEEQFRQAQKLESIGRLASGIAHDFSNLLMGIMMFTELAQRRLPPEDPLTTHLARIKDVGNQATDMIRRLLAFSRKEETERHAAHLNDIVEQHVAILRHVIGEDIKLAVELAEQLPPIMADGEQLHQVLMNLSINARDAMPGGGTLRLATHLLAPGEPVPVTLPRNGTYLRLTMADNGCGMAAEIQDKIFDPFFTTKEVGRGTGLGLATVYNIVKRHGGHIDVESWPGRGTRFFIYLPSCEDTVAEDPPEERESAGGCETILVVEDDDFVVTMIKEMLTHNGYQLLHATHGEQAIELMQRHGHRIDLLLLDLVLPGMNGLEIYRRLRPLYPDLKALCMSGYIDVRDANNQPLLTNEFPLLMKPFSCSELTEAIRALLDA